VYLFRVVSWIGSLFKNLLKKQEVDGLLHENTENAESVKFRTLPTSCSVSPADEALRGRTFFQLCFAAFVPSDFTMLAYLSEEG
jgi:hypothetical protein